MNILIVTEANKQVASGHLMESIVLAKELIQKEQNVLLAVNNDVCNEWKKFLENLPIFMYEKDLNHGMRNIKNRIKKEEFDAIVIDVRQLRETQVKRLRKDFGGKIICLDEWGNRKLSCDVIVNNMMSSYFWNYKNSKATLYCGIQYLMLNQSLQKYHNREKKINKTIKKIVISMGGVDLKNHTLEVLQHVLQLPQIIRVDVVMGGNYGYEEELRAEYENDRRVMLYKNIDYLFDLFWEDDLAFSAGGNTLYEMASIGIPSIVVPTMEHEKINGMEFQKEGYGIVLDEDDLDRIVDIIMLMTTEERLRMSEKGKKLVDGIGIKRIWDIINDICSAGEMN